MISAMGYVWRTITRPAIFFPTILAAADEALSRCAAGERVEQVRLICVLQSEQTATLITVSGKEFEVPSAVLLAGGGVH